MKVAASSCCWWHDSLESAVAEAAAAGFTAFDREYGDRYAAEGLFYMNQLSEP